MFLRCGSHSLDLSRPIVMGVLNVTPDSFSDGGRFSDVDACARARAARWSEEGAGLIDVGGESTRPGAAPVAAEEEIRRVVPVIEALARRTVRTDLRRHQQGGGHDRRRACRREHDQRRAGAAEPGALEAAARSNAAICLMHMQGEPRTMQEEPATATSSQRCATFLRRADRRMRGARASSRDRLVVDPGIGFGKRLEHNLALLGGVAGISQDLRLPLLVGVSRKSMFGACSAGRSTSVWLAGWRSRPLRCLPERASCEYMTSAKRRR